MLGTPGLRVAPYDAARRSPAGHEETRFRDPWGAIAFGLFAGCLGMALSWEVVIADPLAPSQKLQFGQGGVIVVINVLLFVVSMALGPRWKARLSREAHKMRAAA